MADTVVLGDEAVALAAVHAGIIGGVRLSRHAVHRNPRLPHQTSAPGGSVARHVVQRTRRRRTKRRSASSFVGRRALVSMKHVGLNVAADPFMNSALVAINGGLVVAVADDPGMHSSQNEQDSRFYADFARVPASSRPPSRRPTT